MVLATPHRFSARMTDSFQARKRADLLSITGATLAGVAVGALGAEAVRPLGWYLLSGGLLAHAVGMAARHRLDRMEGDPSRTWAVLYVGFWAVIVAVRGDAAVRWLSINLR